MRGIIVDKESSERNGVAIMRPEGMKKLSVSWSEVLKSGSSSLHERIRGCWMGTAYLAGLYAGTSQHKIPSTSLSLHVLGLIYWGGGGF